MTGASKSETGRQRFLRLAQARMDTALKKISLIGNLAGPSYEYEPDEAKQMIQALTEAVDDVAEKFNRKKTGKSGGFSFRTK
jgi:hypothetical protein